MKLLVTGGAGRVGIAVVDRLVRAGHELTVAGRTPRDAAPGTRYRQCDITDRESLLPAVKGMDAIVHLAAIPGPSREHLPEIFRTNCCGTFNVYEAAARAGIRRVVTASSINALGFNFGIKSFPIPYLPVDERIPGFSTDAYSFSKQVTERIADYAWRREGITSVCLRLPYVAPAARSERTAVLEHAAKCQASLDALLSLSPEARRQTIDNWIAARDRCRAERCTEEEEKVRAYVNPDILMQGMTDFWTRIDERDSAQSVERALLANLQGSHTFFVNDSHNFTGLPSLTLARLFFPEAECREEALSGTSTLVSNDAARELLRYEPEYSVSRWF